MTQPPIDLRVQSFSHRHPNYWGNGSRPNMKDKSSVDQTEHEEQLLAFYDYLNRLGIRIIRSDTRGTRKATLLGN